MTCALDQMRAIHPTERESRLALLTLTMQKAKTYTGQSKAPDPQSWQKQHPALQSVTKVYGCGHSECRKKVKKLITNHIFCKTPEYHRRCETNSKPQICRTVNICPLCACWVSTYPPDVRKTILLAFTGRNCTQIYVRTCVSMQSVLLFRSLLARLR